MGGGTSNRVSETPGDGGLRGCRSAIGTTVSGDVVWCVRRHASQGDDHMQFRQVDCVISVLYILFRQKLQKQQSHE